MEIKADNSYRVDVPVSELIEDYQALRRAMKKGDWSLVESVAECIACIVECAGDTGKLSTPLSFHPSVSSIVAPINGDGILVSDDGVSKDDIRCAAAWRVSDALRDGILQEHCEKCPHYKHGCSPEDIEIMLDENFTYTGVISSDKAKEYLAEKYRDS